MIGILDFGFWIADCGIQELGNLGIQGLGPFNFRHFSSLLLANNQ